MKDLRLEIEKGRLEAGEGIKVVKQWGATIEETIDEVDIKVADLTCHLKEAETKEQNKKQEE